MAKTPARVLVTHDLQQREGILDALECAEQWAQASGAAKSAVLLVHVKEQLRHGSLVRQAVGADKADRLASNSTAEWGEWLLLSAETERTAGCLDADIIIAVQPSQKLLYLAEETRRECIIVVPLTMEEVEPWVWASDPEFRGEPPEGIQRRVMSPDLEEGLQSIASRGGLSHRTDKRQAVRVLKRLDDADELTPSADQIKAWFVCQGCWRLTDAEQIAKVYQGVVEGRRFHL